MTLNTFLVRLAFLLLPGIIAARVYRKLRRPGAREPWEAFTEILLFALLSYGTVGVFFAMFPDAAPPVPSTQPAASATPALTATTRSTTGPTTRQATYTAIDAIVNEALPLPWGQIISACGFGVAWAMLGSWLHKKHFFNKLAFAFDLTKRDGDGDVWNRFHDTYGPPSPYEWAFVRDLKANVCYFGQIRRFSASTDPIELVMEDVVVFKNDTGERLYEVKALYLVHAPEDLTIEYPEPKVQRSSGNEQGTTAATPNDRDPRAGTQAG